MINPESVTQNPGKILNLRNKEIMYPSDHGFVLTAFEIDLNR
jgi:hypothetical protein